jgi:hypothetical protein
MSKMECSVYEHFLRPEYVISHSWELNLAIKSLILNGVEHIASPQIPIAVFQSLV